jgi:hypothetical protein
MISIDDELISKMLENTLRFGVFGKVEQKRRRIDLLGLNEDEMDMPNMMVESPKKKDTSMIMSARAGGMSAEEIEILRKQNAELLEQIKKLKQQPHVVNSNGCCATTCNIF